MKIIGQLLFLLFISFPILGQDNSTDSITSRYSYDFSEIWLEPTYQGVIGIDNQRIQVKFLTVKKDATYSNIYIVTGKTIVHDNVCDFAGVLNIKTIIEKSNELDKNSYSTVEGEYTIRENPDQSHVGSFKGKFITKFKVVDNKAIAFNGEFSNEGCSEFTGEWTQYEKSIPKVCNWGRQIPPSGESFLFEHCNEGKYQFDMKYLDNGWKSYVIANLNILVDRPDELVKKYTMKDIEHYKLIESREWWKD